MHRQHAMSDSGESLRILSEEEGSFQSVGWPPQHLQFLRDAESALASDACRRWVGRRVRVPQLPHKIPGDFLPFNRTQGLINVGAPRFHHFISNAIVELTHLALTVRIFCSVYAAHCAELLAHWRAAWCLMLRRLKKATALLPRSGRVPTAFGTTTAALITQALPQDLIFPLSSLATGKADIHSAMAAVDNVSITFTEYFEASTLLGDEMLQFGRTRVGRAQYHGEAPNLFAVEGILHRASVLLWALAHRPGNREDSIPHMVEVGVNRAECSVRMLSNSRLKWLGVDLYVSVDRDGPIYGGSPLTEARAALSPWLGSRAQLMLDQSTSAAQSWQGLREFDLVFVDADHEEPSVRRDIEAWSPLLRKGGVLAGHDYARIWPGVVAAAHGSLPPNTTLHLAPDMVFWWYKPHAEASSWKTHEPQHVPHFPECVVWFSMHTHSSPHAPLLSQLLAAQHRMS